MNLPHHLARLLMLCLPVMLVLIVIGLLVGWIFPAPLPAMARALTSDECALPCWHGITPGETTMNQAEQRLQELGYEPHPMIAGSYLHDFFPDADADLSCTVQLQPESGIVAWINLTDCAGQARIGDVMVVLGQPDTFMRFPSISLAFTDARVSLIPDLPCDTLLRPHTRVRALNLGRVTRGGRERLPWQGFRHLYTPCVLVF